MAAVQAPVRFADGADMDKVADIADDTDSAGGASSDASGPSANWKKAKSAGVRSVMGFTSALTAAVEDELGGSEPRGPEPLDAAQSEVAELLKELLPIFASHMDRAVRRDEPSGYGTRWWHGQPARHREGAEDEEAAAERRRHETPLERRRREEKEEEEEFEILKFGPAPSDEQRAREEERRRRTRTEALSHGLQAIALLRARSDLLTHRLTKIDATDVASLELLADSIVRYTPLSGTLDLDPHVVGAVPLGPHLTPSVQPPGYPFARGTPHAHVANPMMLSMELRQVHKLTVEPAQAADDYHTIPGRPLIPSRPSHAPPPATSAAIALLPREQLPPLPPLSGQLSNRWVPPSSATTTGRDRNQIVGAMLGGVAPLGEDAKFEERLAALPDVGLPDPRQDEGVLEYHVYSHSSFHTRETDRTAFAPPPGSYEDAAYP